MNKYAFDLNLPKKRLFVKPASLWKRLGGLLIDLVLVYFVFLIPIMGIAAAHVALPATFAEAMSYTIPTQLYLAFGLFVVLVLLYFTMFEYYLRRTLGMYVVGIYLDGKVNFGKALLRNVFVIPIFPFYLLWVIEPLHIIFYGHRFMESLTKTRDVEFFEAY